MIMQRQILERALTAAFACSTLLSLYLALYWTAPYILWGNPNNGEAAVKAACEIAQGCSAARMKIGFSGEAHRPVYVAHLKVRAGAKTQALQAAARSAMLTAVAQQSMPFRWVLDERSIAVEVTHHE